MDLSQLQDILEEGSYVPSFGNASRAPVNKLTKNNSNNNSNKSLNSNSVQPAVSPPVERPRANMMQIHKQSRNEVKTFQDFFKENNQAKTEPKFGAKLDVKQVWKPSKQTMKTDELNVNSILDDDDEPPTIGQRKMKPPIIRKNDDAKSVASKRNDDNRSSASVADFRRQNRQQQKQFINIAMQIDSPRKNIRGQERGQKQNVREIIKQKQAYKQVKEVGNYGGDQEIKRIFQDQLQLQRQLNQKLMKEEKEAHKNQLERLKTSHEQQINKRLELKDLQISKLKEYYEMQLKIRKEREQQMRGLSNVRSQVEEGVKALERAETQLKNKSVKFQEQREWKGNQIKSFQNFSKQKQEHIQRLFEKLQNRQKQFRQDKQRILTDLDRERKRIEQMQIRLLKKQREFDQKYQKKQRNLIEQFQNKTRSLLDDKSKLRIQQIQLQQSKIKLNQQKQQLTIRNKKWDQTRSKFMEELQLERTKIITREVELNSRSNQWEVKDSQVQLREKELIGKMKLAQLQRKKWEVQRQMKKKLNHQSKIGSGLRFADKQDRGPSNFEKSIKQLKDEYLRNLGQL